jgi:hypothetical protein
VKRLAIAGAAVVVAALLCVALIALLASLDDSQVGEGGGPAVLEPDRGADVLPDDAPARPASPPQEPPTSGPHKADPVARDASELSDDQLLRALAQGNVVLAYGGNEPPRALATLQEDVSGPYDPEVAAAGQAVILARRAGVDGVIALAWRRKLETRSPEDPALHEFAEAYLGQGPNSQR